MDYKYILDNKHNALRFVFDDAFLAGTFYCILEWEDGSEGKLTVFKWFSDIWIEKFIEYSNVEKIINILNKYDYFNKQYFKDYQGLDGWEFGLEVKYKQNYKELCIWGIENGILYDIGMLLLKIAGKTFIDFYEYAW